MGTYVVIFWGDYMSMVIWGGEGEDMDGWGSTAGGNY